MSVLGPLVALAIFRDRPDFFVPLATVIAALLPVVALTHSFVAPAAEGAPPAL